MNRRSCGICNVDVHGASCCRHLRSEKHTKNEVKNEMIMIKMMLNPFYYTDKLSIKGIKINLDPDRIDRINQLHSKVAIESNHPEILINSKYI